jgi:hypothetical protein
MKYQSIITASLERKVIDVEQSQSYHAKRTSRDG